MNPSVKRFDLVLRRRGLFTGVHSTMILPRSGQAPVETKGVGFGLFAGSGAGLVPVETQGLPRCPSAPDLHCRSPSTPHPLLSTGARLPNRPSPHCILLEQLASESRPQSISIQVRLPRTGSSYLRNMKYSTRALRLETNELEGRGPKLFDAAFAFFSQLVNERL